MVLQRPCLPALPLRWQVLGSQGAGTPPRDSASCPCGSEEQHLMGGCLSDVSGMTQSFETVPVARGTQVCPVPLCRPWAPGLGAVPTTLPDKEPCKPATPQAESRPPSLPSCPPHTQTPGDYCLASSQRAGRGGPLGPGRSLLAHLPPKAGCGPHSALP